MEPDKTSDYILCECPLENLVAFATDLARHYAISLIKAPAICLTMIRAEDSLEKQEFYLGEALTTDCEVAIDGTLGYGICLGDEPERAYHMAVVEAVLALNDERRPEVEQFLNTQLALIRHRDELEFNQIMRTRVDFKLMEQA